MLLRRRRRAAALQNAVRDTMMIEKREASWTAPALWRFAGIRTIRRISDEPFCANINRNYYRASLLRRLLADQQVSPAGLAFVPTLIETAIQSWQSGSFALPIDVCG